MGNISLAVPCGERHGDALGADCQVAGLGVHEKVVQQMIGARIDCSASAPCMTDSSVSIERPRALARLQA
jgi:hypothetical protein